MPYQGDLYLGVRVDSRKEALAALRELHVRWPAKALDGKTDVELGFTWRGQTIRRRVLWFVESESDRTASTTRKARSSACSSRGAIRPTMAPSLASPSTGPFDSTSKRWPRRSRQ